MKTSIKTLLFLIINLYSVILIAGDKNATASEEAKARQWIKKQSRYFIENKGQIANYEGKAADNVLFKANFGNCDIYITTEGISYVFLKPEDRSPKSEERKPRFEDSELAQKHIISYYRMDMKLLGAVINKDSIIKEQEGNQGHYNYFYPHCPDGIYNVNEYGKITVKSIYPGIDWIIYTNTVSENHPLKYDFIIHPQADYKQIKIKYINAQDVNLTAQKSMLNIKSIAGNIAEDKLYCYQAADNAEIKSSYQISNDTVSFQIAPYDKSQTIIIDPLVWATYYGGIVNEYESASCIDSQNNLYITGYTYSIDFPTQNLIGAFWQSGITGNYDIYISKFNSNGVKQWSTFYGGSKFELSRAICVNHQDEIFILGHSSSTNFPTQAFAGSYNQSNNAGVFGVDLIILKFNCQGQRQWATYYGGENNEDSGNDICVDSQDNLYITGETSSIYFPLQQLSGAYWQSYNSNLQIGVFIIKFNNLLQRQWATLHSGIKGNSICVDSHDNIYVTGYIGQGNTQMQQLSGAYFQANNAGDYDIFILKFNNLGVRKWATYYGGSHNDIGWSIYNDNHDNLYITGTSGSLDFPIQQFTGAFFQSIYGGGWNDIFILKFDSNGQRLWATYYGGNDDEVLPCLKIDKQNNIYITGATLSTNLSLQLMTNVYFQQFKMFGSDMFILRFNKLLQKQWATYYGSSSNDYGMSISIDHNNAIYFTGEWSGDNAFTVDYGNGSYFENNNLGLSDNFILKFIFCNSFAPDSAKVSRNNFCASDNGNIKLIALGGVGDTLKWYKDGCRQNYIGSGDTLIIPSPTNTTTYYALWKSCDTTYSPCVSVTVTVDTATARKPVLLSSNKNNFCSTDSSIIKLNAVGGSGDTLKWYAGSCGQNYQGKGDSIFIASPQQTTTYYARWESRCDTSACNSITVNVKPTPVVDLGADAFICEGQSINLTVNQSNATFLWQNGSNSNSFTVNKPGIYWVSVNQNNCYASDTIQFVLCEPPLNIWIPNAFTPNGDGINDIFRIETINKLQEFRMYIFNRWGQLIFESNNQNKGWDGKCDGTSVQEGVYFWKMEYIWADSYGISKKVEKDGIVTLVK